MLGVPRQALRSQHTPIVLAAVIATVGCYSFYSNSARNASPSGPTKTFGRGPSPTSLRLHSIETLSPDTKRFRFMLPTEDAVSGLNLTSALLTFSRPEGHFWPVIRPYTPVSDLDEPGFIDLAIKKYEKGKASTHIHSLAPGDSLFFIGAIGAYPWKLNEFNHITLIAGGAGITPMYQLIKGIFKNPEEKTKVTLLFGINSDEDALFRDEFAKYEKNFPGRFKVVYTVSNPSEGSPYQKGRVSKELLQKVMSDSQEKSGKVFFCGPPGMEASLLGSSRPSWGAKGGILGELGYTKDQIYKF